VAVERLDAGQQLAVVAARDEDLGVRARGRLEQRQRAGGQLVLLDEGDLVFTVIRRVRYLENM